MDFLIAMIRALPEAARTPLGITGFVCLLATWLLWIQSRHRVKTFLGGLKEIPEAQRPKYCQDAGYKYSEISGLSEKDQFRAVFAKYTLIAYLATLLAFCLFGIPVYQETLEKRRVQVSGYLKTAKQALREYKNKEARDLYLKILALDDSEIEGYAGKAMAEFRLGLYDDARTTLDLGFGVFASSKTPDDIELSNMHAVRGALYRHSSDYNRALDEFKLALKAAGRCDTSQLDCSRQLAKCHGNIANVHSNTGKYREARSHYLTALRLDSLAGDNHGYLADLVNYGATYLNTKDFDSAAGIFLIARAKAEQWKDWNERVHSTWMLARAYETKRPAASRDLYMEADEYFDIAEHSNQRMYARMLGDFGDFLITQKDFDLARIKLLQSLKISVDQGDISGIGCQLGSLSLLSMEKRDIPCVISMGLAAKVFLKDESDPEIADFFNKFDGFLRRKEVKSFPHPPSQGEGMLSNLYRCTGITIGRWRSFNAHLEYPIAVTAP